MPRLDSQGRDRSMVLVPEPTDAELGYLAGIMDGEGYFSASLKSNSFGMRVQMIDAEVIDWLHEHFVGSVSRMGLTVAGNRVHVWTLSRQADLAFVLGRLIRFLVLKRGRAEAMLALVEHLQARPCWDVSTSRVSDTQRRERRQVKKAWKARERDLRAQITGGR